MLSWVDMKILRRKLVLQSFTISLRKHWEWLICAHRYNKKFEVLKHFSLKINLLLHCTFLMYCNVESFTSYWLLHLKWKYKHSNINMEVIQGTIINAVIDSNFNFSCTFSCLLLPVIYVRIWAHESGAKTEPASCSPDFVSTLIHNFMPFLILVISTMNVSGCDTWHFWTKTFQKECYLS